MSNAMPLRGERIEFVELFPDGRPFSFYASHPRVDRVTGAVTRGGRTYDIEWSRAERAWLFQDIGGGPHMEDWRRPWWARADFDVSAVKLYSNGSGKQLRRAIPRGNRVPDATLVPCPGRPKREWFPIAELEARASCSEGRMVYCFYCNDWFDGGQTVATLCRHVSWCDECGVWSEPQERCRHDTRVEVA